MKDKVESWQAWADCRQFDPELFFNDTPDITITTMAKLVCYECPVRQECLDAAIQNKEKHGVWGGMTEVERRRHARGKTVTNFKLVERYIKRRDDMRTTDGRSAA